MTKDRLLRPWWRNPLVAWRLQSEGIYTWSNLCIAALMMLFLIGAWFRFRAFLYIGEFISFVPQDHVHELSIRVGATTADLTGYVNLTITERAGINFQMLAIAGLIVLYLLESTRARYRNRSRWDNPEGDQMRMLPIPWQDRHFAIVQWPCFKTSMTILFCALMLVIVPSRVVPLWPVDDLLPIRGQMFLGHRALWVSGQFFLALLTLALLACVWLLYWMEMIERERGMAIFLDPVTLATYLVAYIASIHFRGVFFPQTIGINPVDAPIEYGLQLYGGVFATMVAAWVLAAWAKHRYFRLVEKRLEGDG